MTRTAARWAAFAGFLALLCVVGCDPNGSSGSSSGGSSGTLTSSAPMTFPAAYVPGTSTGANASQTTTPSSAPQTDPSSSSSDQSLEQQSQDAGQTFDGTGDNSNQAPAVPVPTSTPAKPKPPLTPSTPHPPTGIDQGNVPPPPPALDAAGQACQSVLASHGQKSDCKNPTTDLVWGGIKNALAAQFTSWKTAAETIVLTAIGYVLTGGLGGVAKLLKILLMGGAAIAFLKMIGDLYGAVRDMIKNANGTKEHADAVWRVANVSTKIAIDAGLFTAGGAAGKNLPIKTP